MLILGVADMTPGEGAKQPSTIEQERLVKSLSIVCPLLIDCGKASAQIRGGSEGPFWEANLPPYTRWF